MKRPPGSEMRERARRLRREMTPQEKILWSHLRGRRCEGFKFRRQMWLAGYIADLACPEAKVVIEADGSQHADNLEYDQAREAAFERLDWRTLRFWNNEIHNDLEGVLTAIRAALPSPSHLAAPGGPLPLPGSAEAEGERSATAHTPLPIGEREGPARDAGGRVRGNLLAPSSPSPASPLARHPLPCRERES